MALKKAAGATVPPKSDGFALMYRYKRDTKGTWVYEVCDADGEFIDTKAVRVSGPSAVYLLKSEYPERPASEYMIGSFNFR